MCLVGGGHRTRGGGQCWCGVDTEKELQLLQEFINCANVVGKTKRDLDRNYFPSDMSEITTDARVVRRTHPLHMNRVLGDLK